MEKKRIKEFLKIIFIFGIIIFICLKIIYSTSIKTYKSEYANLEKRDDIYIEVEENSVTQTSLSYKIYNNTEQKILYGIDYEIEVYKNDGWKKFGVEVSWIEIAVELDAKSTNEEKIDWKNVYGKLSKGKYRIIKTINNISIVDEFEIK